MAGKGLERRSMRGKGLERGAVRREKVGMGEKVGRGQDRINDQE